MKQSTYRNLALASLAASISGTYFTAYTFDNLLPRGAWYSFVTGCWLALACAVLLGVTAWRLALWLDPSTRHQRPTR